MTGRDPARSYPAVYLNMIRRIEGSITMSNVTACKDAKEQASIGSIMTIIGVLLLSTIFIMLILVWWYPILFAFLAVWGWVLGIIGAILAIAGHLLARAQRTACTKCCLG